MAGAASITPNDDAIHTTGGIFGFSIVVIFSITITYDIIRKLIKKFAEKKNDFSSETSTSIDIRLMIYIDLFIILIHMILTSINFVLSSDTDCTLITKCCTITYHISRCLMYLIFVRRIEVIYDQTVFAMSRFHAYILYGVIAMYSIPYISYINWSLLDITYHPQYGCLIQYKSSICFFIMAVLDILIAIYCLYLFVYPLYRLIHQQESKQISVKLYSVMIKYCILYSSSICSAILLISLSYSFSFGYNYGIIDGLINGMILILLHPIHNRLYKITCCILHSCCNILCDAPRDDDDDNFSIKRKSKRTNNNIKKEREQTMKKKLAKNTKNKICSISSQTMKTSVDDIERRRVPSLTQINSPSAKDNVQEIPPITPSTQSIRDMMKERAMQRFHSSDMTEIVKTIRLNTLSSSPSNTTDENEENDNSVIAMSCDLSLEIHQTSNSIKSVMSDDSNMAEIGEHPDKNINNNDMVEVILEDESVNLDDLILNSLKPPPPATDLEQKRSNILRFINYESIKL